MGFWRSKQLTFIMTNQCNIDCTYCYPGNYKYGNMEIDMDFARRGIHDFLIEEKLGPLDRIRYFGIGEPTTKFTLMKQIQEYIYQNVVNEKGHHIYSEIQTNGVFSETVAHWIGENLDTICISCDGFPQIHDKQRPFKNGKPTSAIIERNVGILRQYDIDVGMRATITSLSQDVDTQKTIIDYAQDVGYQYLYFHPMIPEQGTDKFHNDDTPYNIDPLGFSTNYVEAWKYAREKKDIFVGNHFTINFDEKAPIYCRANLPSPQLTLDKYVSCCDEALYGDPKYGGDRFKKLIIGKYNKENNEIELFPDRIADIRHFRCVHNMDGCKDCEIAENCAGGCLGEALFSTGDPFKKLSDGYCEAIKYLARHIPMNQGEFRYRHP